MADGDDFLAGLLKNTTQLDGVSFAGATGVKWGRVASGLVGSFLVAYYTGFIGIIQTASDRLAGIVEGIAAFLVGPLVVDTGTAGDASSVESLPGLLFAAVDLARSGLSGAFVSNLSEYGAVGYIVGVLSVLAAAWVLSLLADWINGRYL